MVAPTGSFARRCRCFRPCWRSWQRNCAEGRAALWLGDRWRSMASRAVWRRALSWRCSTSIFCRAVEIDRALDAARRPDYVAGSDDTTCALPWRCRRPPPSKPPLAVMGAGTVPYMLPDPLWHYPGQDRSLIAHGPCDPDEHRGRAEHATRPHEMELQSHVWRTQPDVIVSLWPGQRRGGALPRRLRSGCNRPGRKGVPEGGIY